MFKSKVLMIFALGLALLIIGLNGCSSKKKTTEPVKQETTKPQTQRQRPSPPAVVPRTPERTEPSVPRDLQFETIYFDFDKSDIRSDQRASLSKNAQLLSRYSSVNIRVEGHCDERGTEEYNIALGQRRADAVVNYLTNYGISSSRIRTISFGEMRMVDSGHTEAAWSKNRRAEISTTSR
ncbi:peptidoglycan-associated lipoprotein Pal [Candidatus Latescibacterota bacterium]